MKNMYVFAILAFLILAGCTHDEYTGEDLPGFKADIRGTIDGVTTRASETSWDIGDCIGVTGNSNEDVNIKYQYTGDASGSFEVVDGEDEDNAIFVKSRHEVEFTAYYPYTGSNREEPGEISVVTGSAQQLNQPEIDFLFASVGASRENPIINFVFEHKMSKLTFNFKAAEGLELSSIHYTLFDLALKGTFNPMTGEAEANLENAKGTELDVDVPFSSEMSSSLILLPQDVLNVYIELIMDGSYYESLIENLILESGYEHIYNVTINRGSEIELPYMEIESSEIRPWKGGDTQDITATPEEPGAGVNNVETPQWGNDSGNNTDVNSTQK